MNGYNFTNDVRVSLARAREESARLGHEYVGTEHILLGMLSDDNVAVQVIATFGIDPESLVKAVDDGVKKGTSHDRTGPDLPYTSRAKKVLELSMAEARELGHNYVGTEHLFLGVLREEKGIAAQILIESGIALDVARQRVIEVLGRPSEQDRPGRVRRIPRTASIAAMKVWDEKASPRPLAVTGVSPHMAASLIETLAQDADVRAIFSAQGIDVAKLTAALRSPPAA